MRRFKCRFPSATTFGGFQKDRQGLAPENSINIESLSAVRTLTTKEVFRAFGPTAAMRHKGRAAKATGTFRETFSSSSGSSLLGWRPFLGGNFASPGVLWEIGREEHKPTTVLSVCPTLAPVASAGSLGSPSQSKLCGLPVEGREGAISWSGSEMNLLRHPQASPG